jgi:hypothetical protein
MGFGQVEVHLKENRAEHGSYFLLELDLHNGSGSAASLQQPWRISWKRITFLTQVSIMASHTFQTASTSLTQRWPPSGLGITARKDHTHLVGTSPVQNMCWTNSTKQFHCTGLGVGTLGLSGWGSEKVTSHQSLKCSAFMPEGPVALLFLSL